MRKKSKGYQRGGKMVPKGMSAGGAGKMPMKRDKDGEMRPAFVVDAEGKAAGGVASQKVPKTKGFFKGGRTMKNKMNTKGGAKGGGMKGGGKAMKSKMNTKGGMRGGGRAMKNKMNTKGGKRGGGR